MAINALIPLRAQQFSAAQLENDLQTARSNTLTNRLNELRLGEARSTFNRENRLRELMPGVYRGDPEATNQAFELDPKEVFSVVSQMNEAQRARAAEIAQQAGGVLQGYMSTAPDQRNWGMVQQSLAQLGVNDVPMQPSEQWVRGELGQAGLLLDTLKQVQGGDSSFSKSLTPAYDAQGNLVYVQGTDAGGARVVEGFKPLGPEYEGREAAAVALAKQGTPGGQAEVAADQAQAEAAQAKVEADERSREKVRSTRRQAVNIINSLLDPARADTLEAATGSIAGRLPSLRQPVVDFENDLEALKATLTTENLDLMTGVLSESDIKLLQQVATGGLDLTSSAGRMRRTLERVRQALSKDLGGTEGGFKSPAQVQSAPMEEVRRYVEGATADELDRLPAAVRNAIVKRLSGGGNGDGR